MRDPEVARVQALVKRTHSLIAAGLPTLGRRASALPRKKSAAEREKRRLQCVAAMAGANEPLGAHLARQAQQHEYELKELKKLAAWVHRLSRQAGSIVALPALHTHANSAAPERRFEPVLCLAREPGTTTPAQPRGATKQAAACSPQAHSPRRCPLLALRHGSPRRRPAPRTEGAARRCGASVQYGQRVSLASPPAPQ